MAEPVTVVRVYGEAGRSGAEHRVLVDRLWPRGRRKDEVELDEWARDVAPSTELRRWYGHDVERFDAFRARYLAELATAPAGPEADRLAATARQRPVVLLTATRDVAHSGAAVLAAEVARRRDVAGREPSTG